MDTKNEQSVGQTHENGQSHGVAAVAAGSAKHRCVRIRPGLYNYRAYNIRRFSKGWAVLTEEGKPWHSPIDTLSGVCRMVDKIEARGLPADERPPEPHVVEMALCEAGRIMPRLGVLYRFTVQPTCQACAEAAAPYLPNTQGLTDAENQPTKPTR